MLHLRACALHPWWPSLQLLKLTLLSMLVILMKSIIIALMLCLNVVGIYQILINCIVVCVTYTMGLSCLYTPSMLCKVIPCRTCEMDKGTCSNHSDVVVKWFISHEVVERITNLKDLHQRLIMGKNCLYLFYLVVALYTSTKPLTLLHETLV